MSKWLVSEQSIYDENGQQVIEASEWYMRGDLQKICDEHNEFEVLKSENEMLKIKSKAAYDFITKQITAFESEPLDANGKHNLYVGKEFLERAKKALIDLGWIEG